MAKKTQVLLIDDIDGRPADGTVEFGIDGQLYSIDLAKEHSLELYKGLEKFREAGTRLGRYHVAKASRGLVTPAPRKAMTVNRDRNAAIRQWCAEQNITISARGRIPESVVAQYDAAHAK